LVWGINDSRDFDVSDYPVPPRDEDAQHVIDRTIAPAAQEPVMYWESILDKDCASYSSVILSWFYEKELCLFVIKRKEGCQYVSPMKNHFKSLSKSDLLELGNSKLINPDNDKNAEFYAKRIRDDYLLRFRSDSFDKSRLFIEPRSRKKVTKDDGTVEYVQRPIECMERVPAKKWKQNLLGNLDHWEIDRNSGEAKMYADQDKKIILMRMSDPMQLVNVSRFDQRRLYDTECLFIPFWKTEENRYRKILRICLHARIHGDSRRLLFGD
jgi:hypothetical protein